MKRSELGLSEFEVSVSTVGPIVLRYMTCVTSSGEAW